MQDKTDWMRVREEETQQMAMRRELLRRQDNCTCQFPQNPVGLALSGGGIRSATFSLGLMRSLSEQRLIHCVDYLSTVSGGGYAGAFFCSLFVPNRLRGPAPLPRKEAGDADADPEQPSSAESGKGTGDVQDGANCDVLGMESGRDAIALLRQGGHYLAPNGTSDALFAAVIALRNWFAIAITTGVALLAIFFAINFAIAALELILERWPLYLDHFGKDEQGVWRFILVGIAFWPASCAWAYWFTRSGHVPVTRWMRLFSIQSLAALLIVALALFWPARREGWHEVLRDGIVVIGLLSIIVYGFAEFWTAKDDRSAGATRAARNRVEALAEEDRVRNRLSRWLLRGTVALAATAAFALLHLASRGPTFRDPKFFKDVSIEPQILGAAAVATGVVIVLARAVFRNAGGVIHSRQRRILFSPRVRQVVSLIFGLALLAAFVAFWATMAGGASQWMEEHTRTAWGNIGERAPWLRDGADRWVLRPLGIPINSPDSATLLLLLVTLKFTLIAYLIGNVDSLLNRSSFSTFYSGRLRSAYLGATNLRRHRLIENQAKSTGSQDEIAVPLDRDDPNDEITLASYYRKAVKAPIHLINVTINETTSKSSRVIQRDRKGKSMTVAPSGYLYSPRSPADPLAILRREDAEDLPLSSWMAISGAAFTTGAGHHTSLGTAMLATLTNMRLGYWWNMSNRPTKWPLRGAKRLVQTYLLRELRASYEGTGASRWYLSDGGHYENTGAYELIRRRIPFIIASDNGADPYYEFGDLVNLIRKARIDFSTEIEFLDGPELDFLFVDSPLRDVFGSLDEIRKSGKQATRAADDPGTRQPKAGPYATLARVLYPRLGVETAATGTLLWIKPRITGRELPDLVQYRDVNAAFPQQPTTNQFFDEAQWESYYRLGQLIGDMIFKKDRFPQEPGLPRWNPWDLEPLPT